MGDFTQKKWGGSSRGIGENGRVGRAKMRTDTSRNPGLKLQHNDLHYLSKSFDFYPCKCQTHKNLTVQLALKCHDCLMSPQSRISHMRTKI